MKKYIVEIHCFDANGYYDMHFKRIDMVMRSIGESKLLEKKWGRSTAIGGSWALSLILKYETTVPPLDVKKAMIGLEYLLKEDVADNEIFNGNTFFRIADIMTKKLRAFLCSEFKYFLAKGAETCPHCNASFEEKQDNGNGSDFGSSCSLLLCCCYLALVRLNGSSCKISRL